MSLAKVVDVIPLFYANRRSTRGKPNNYIRRTDAVKLVENGLASWTNARCKSITIKYKETELPRPAESCTMGPLVSYLAACKVPRYVELVKTWGEDRAA